MLRQLEITGLSRQILFEGLSPQTQDLHGFFRQLASTTNMILPKTKRWHFGILIGIPLLALLIWDLYPYLEYSSNMSKLREAIPIGSNIDDAPKVLERNGFRFVDKHFATVAEDRYWIDVRVAWKSRPWTLRIFYLMGIDIYFQWAVIEADLENRVVAIRG